MKKQTLKVSLSIIMSACLVTAPVQAEDGFFSNKFSGVKKYFNDLRDARADIKIPAGHPCGVVLNLEKRQIDLMQDLMEEVKDDSELRGGMAAYSSASDLGAGVKAALKGDYETAIVKGIGTVIAGAVASKIAKKGIKDTKNNVLTIQERQERMMSLIASPDKCTAEERKSLMTSYLEESILFNSAFIAEGKRTLAKFEKRDTLLLSSTATLIAGIATIVTFRAMSKNGGNFIAPGLWGLGTLIGGVWIFTDFADRAQISQFRAVITSLEQANSLFSTQLNELNK